jgi:hypothetical protein
VTDRLCQSRCGSLTEAVANVVAGFLLAMLAQQIVFPFFGIATTLGEDAGIAAIFTALSLFRSYAIRRLFERFGSGRNGTALLSVCRMPGSQA